MTQPTRLDLRRLGTIGARGMVVHAGQRVGGKYAFFADNEHETWRRFPINDIDAFAQQHGFDAADLRTLIANSAPIAVMKVAAGTQGKTVFVNLDAFQNLAEPSEGNVDSAALYARHLSQENGFPPDFTVLLIHEKQKFYALLADKLHHLDTADAGEAKVLVRRGTVTAGIPNNDIPIGTDCVLVNLTQILPDAHGGDQ